MNQQINITVEVGRSFIGFDCLGAIYINIIISL